MAGNNSKITLFNLFIVLIMFDHCKVIDQTCNNSLSRIKPIESNCNNGNSQRLICYPITLTNGELNRTHKPSRRFSIISTSAGQESSCLSISEPRSYRSEFENGSAPFLDDYIPLFMEMIADINEWDGCGKLITTAVTIGNTDQITTELTKATITPTTTETMAPITKTTTTTLEQQHLVGTFQIRFKNFSLPITAEFARPCSATTTLLILTMSRRNGFALRNSIRRIWMNDSLPGQNQRFLIADAPAAGDGGEAPEVQKQLEAEQAEHGDLVILHGFVDRYKHLHLKWYGGLLWQQEYCRHAEWLMKADDDTVVYLARLDYWIEHKFQRIAAKHGGLVYFGTIRKINCPFRDKNSKWYVNESVYPGELFPDFAQGAVYLTTTKTIAAILPHSGEIVPFHLDDVVFTGILAEKANVTRVHKLHHFFDHHCNKFNICENGVPTVISIWGFGGQMANEKYGQIKSANCSLELRNGVDRHAYCPNEPNDPPPHCQHKA